jgi:hypothetical protein
MPRSRPRRARTRAEWEALVAEWRASGVNQQAFAKRKGIATTTLSWWSCRLRRETADAPALLPVRVVDAGGASADFVVRLPGRRGSHGARALRRGRAAPASGLARGRGVSTVPPLVKVFLATGVTDMRKSPDRLPPPARM